MENPMEQDFQLPRNPTEQERIDNLAYFMDELDAARFHAERRADRTRGRIGQRVSADHRRYQRDAERAAGREEGFLLALEAMGIERTVRDRLKEVNGEGK